MSRNRIERWIDRELTVLAVIHEIVRSVEEESENYDSIDFLIDLLYSTVIPAVAEYLENEYDISFQESLEGWIDADPDENTRRAAVYADVAGKTFDERIVEYAADGIDGFESKMAALIATDGHRVRSEGQLDAGSELQSAGLTVTKTWRIVGDGKTRDAHDKLAGVTIPYNDNFEIDGYTSPAPGLFGVAELDCNCRCWLTLGVTE